MKDLENFFSSENETAGKIIKSLRHNFNITQSELCEATGISEKYLSAVENDKRPIGLEVASKISVFFHFDPTLLLFPNGTEELFIKFVDIKKKAKEIIANKKDIA